MALEPSADQISANVDLLRQDIQQARKAAERDPPNYFYAGAVSGACLYCIGHCTWNAVARAGTTPQRIFPARISVTGLTRMRFEEHRLGRIGRLTVLAARFDGAGRFTPVLTPALPVPPPHPEQRRLPHPYVSPRIAARRSRRRFSMWPTAQDLPSMSEPSGRKGRSARPVRNLHSFD